jgi:sugar lactone lactonase YvrE
VPPDGGNVVVTSVLSGAVQIWHPRDDQAVETFTDFLFPWNALRFQGDLVVAEVGTGSVVARVSNGVRTTLASGLGWPGGLAANGTDLWVADWFFGQIHQIAGAGAPRVVADGLNSPEGVTVDRDGSLLVVESGAGQLTRIDPTTGVTSTVASGLATDSQGSSALGASELSSVAVDSTGTVFVSAAGSQGSVVYRITAVPTR